LQEARFLETQPGERTEERCLFGRRDEIALVPEPGRQDRLGAE
jgi:hypothetical protein